MTMFMKFFRSDQHDLVLMGKVHVISVIELATQADLQDIWLGQQTFFNGAAHRRPVGILHAPILIPGVEECASPVG